MIKIKKLQAIAEENFADIVTGTKLIDAKLRVFLIDDSYIDFWWSTEIKGRFAHHWERGHIDGTMYRHDNMPHLKWSHVSTFPQHYHEGSNDTVNNSFLAVEPEKSVTEFLQFARIRLKKEKEGQTRAVDAGEMPAKAGGLSLSIKRSE